MKTEHTGCEVPKWGLSSFLSSNARTSSYPELRASLDSLLGKHLGLPGQKFSPEARRTVSYAGSFTPRLAEGNLWGRDLTHPEGFWRTLAQGHRHIQKGKICHI